MLTILNQCMEFNETQLRAYVHKTCLNWSHVLHWHGIDSYYWLHSINTSSYSGYSIKYRGFFLTYDSFVYKLTVRWMYLTYSFTYWHNFFHIVSHFQYLKYTRDDIHINSYERNFALKIFSARVYTIGPYYVLLFKDVLENHNLLRRSKKAGASNSLILLRKRSEIRFLWYISLKQHWVFERSPPRKICVKTYA